MPLPDEYRIEVTTEAQRQEQAARHAELLQRLGQVSTEEARHILQTTRERVEPEADLDPVAAARLRSLLWQSAQAEAGTK